MIYPTEEYFGSAQSHIGLPIACSISYPKLSGNSTDNKTLTSVPDGFHSCSAISAAFGYSARNCCAFTRRESKRFCASELGGSEQHASQTSLYILFLSNVELLFRSLEISSPCFSNCIPVRFQLLKKWLMSSILFSLGSSFKDVTPLMTSMGSELLNGTSCCGSRMVSGTDSMHFSQTPRCQMPTRYKQFVHFAIWTPSTTTGTNAASLVPPGALINSARTRSLNIPCSFFCRLSRIFSDRWMSCQSVARSMKPTSGYAVRSGETKTKFSSNKHVQM